MTLTVTKKKILILTLLCLVVFGGGTAVYYRYFTFRITFREEGPTTKVNLAGWPKLEVGMTKQQVISLLGDAGFKTGPGTTTIEGVGTTYNPEFWEYNWTSGFQIFFARPHPKSYHVYFGKEGELASWREPETADKHNK